MFLAPLIFTGVFIYAIIRSKSKWMTVLVTIGTMAVFFGISFLLMLVMPNMARSIGTLAGMLSNFVGIGACLIHSNKTMKTA